MNKHAFLGLAVGLLWSAAAAAQVVVVSEEPAEGRKHGLRLDGFRAELGAVNPADCDFGPLAGLHASLGTMFVPWLDFTSGVRWWKADFDPAAIGGRSGDLRSLSLHGDWHAHLFRAKGARPYVLTGLSVRRLSASVDGDPSLEDAISGFKTGLDLGAGIASTRRGLGWRVETRRDVVEDAGSWSFTAATGWWPRTSARRSARLAATPAAPVAYPLVTAPPAAAPAQPAPNDLEPIVRKLLADNEALRARLDSLAAAPAPERAAPPEPARIAPAPVEPAAPPAPDLDEAMRRLAELLGDAGALQVTGEGYRLRLSRSTSFPSGGDQPGPDLREDLRKLALLAFRFPHLTFVVEGHTDSAGSASRNMALADARARAVQDELVRLGVEPVRISARGYGSSVPIADNATPEGRAANRRVEIRVLRDAEAAR